MSFLSEKQIAACVKPTLRVRHLDVILIGLQGTFAGAPTGTDTIIETDENGIDFSCRKGREHFIPWFGNLRLCDGGLFHVGRRLQNGLQLVQLLEEALVGSHAAPPTVDVSEGISARRKCEIILSTKNFLTTKNHTHCKTQLSLMTNRKSLSCQIKNYGISGAVSTSLGAQLLLNSS